MHNHFSEQAGDPPFAIDFDFKPRTRIIFGNRTIDRLGELAAELGARRALLVTDLGIVKAGHVAHALKSLTAAGIDPIIFDRVHENPTTWDIDECLAIARSEGIDSFIALGGGSSIDTAKGCNFLLTNGGRMRDYLGYGKATRPMLPLIAIPTTAGTGSECQSFALIADAESHQKMACGDPKAAAAIAILDPTLTLTQPLRVTLDTGLDALVHAVECTVTTKRNPISQLFSGEAFRLIQKHLPEVALQPDNLDARAGMQLGAAYAGTAIENSMLGAAHSAANPLTAHFGVVHGQAVGIMLPRVVAFNAEQENARTAYAELAVSAGLAAAGESPERAVQFLLHRLEALVNLAGLPTSLSHFGLSETAIPGLAEEAARQWTANFNPRRIVAADFADLYRQAL